MHFYSIIIPVYNRPQEIDELLASLVSQTYQNFEVIIVEDGSTQTCEAVVDQYVDRLNLHYFFKENTGQGFSRNFGFAKAKGDYFLVFDSDCILPPAYLQIVDDHLTREPLDAFGGPDKADESFTIVQKAINYSMTSVFTTGGIRGRARHAGPYHPRSFNMGISRAVYEKTGGYIITRMGEDIEFSIRIIANGFKVGLIEEAFVYHKRRTSLWQFYKQLHFFGRARINVSRFYAKEIRLVHFFPVFFLSAWLAMLPAWFIHRPFFFLGVGVLAFYFFLIVLDSAIKNKNILVGVVSIIAATVQLSAYAIGMVTEYLKGNPHQVINQ
jgi:glycosyltransferase involved in cell wall biosynthesis